MNIDWPLPQDLCHNGLAYFAGRADCRLKVLCLGWYFHLGSLQSSFSCPSIHKAKKNLHVNTDGP